MISSNIYIHDTVKAIQDYYGQLLFDTHRFKSIKEHLYALASELHKGILSGHDYLLTEVNNYHPDYLGIPIQEIDLSMIDEVVCRSTIAYEYGFAGWKQLASGAAIAYHLPFEKAVNLVINGRTDELTELLQSSPDLINQRSQYGHRATLLHYCASNGVELWRQQVPINLADIVNVLLVAGADANATIDVYGGAFTTVELLMTSAHPNEAGITNEVATLLS